MTTSDDTSKNDIAVAVTAIARYLSCKDQKFANHLLESLRSAEQAGVPAQELQLTRMLVSSLTLGLQPEKEP